MQKKKKKKRLGIIQRGRRGESVYNILVNVVSIDKKVN
jgi:hypothetical protein